MMNPIVMDQSTVDITNKMVGLFLKPRYFCTHSIFIHDCTKSATGLAALSLLSPIFISAFLQMTVPILSFPVLVIPEEVESKLHDTLQSCVSDDKSPVGYNIIIVWHKSWMPQTSPSTSASGVAFGTICFTSLTVSKTLCKAA